LHLKDNNSNESLSLAPGKGSIPWKPFLANLAQSGYDGSLDIEIGCPAGDVPAEYCAGRDYLAPLSVGGAKPD
jgi:sugar phosphate isomerase/epimerase